jgi:hypothetical protein
LKLLSTTYTFEEIELSLVRLLVFVLLSGCTFAPDELGPVDIESVEEAGAPASPEAGPAVCVAAGGITQMALPFSRNTTYAPGQQIQSADLNDMQDVDVDNIGALITALGGAAPDTLADVIAHGTFTPILAASVSPAFTYSSQVGSFLKIGPWVHARFLIGWTNNDDAQNTNPAVIVPPYAAEASTTWTGVLDYAESSFGTAGTTITTAALRLSAALGGVQVQGRATTMGSSAIILAYGDSNARSVAGSIWYKTSGTFNY